MTPRVETLAYPLKFQRQNSARVVISCNWNTFWIDNRLASNTITSMFPMSIALMEAAPLKARATISNLVTRRALQLPLPATPGVRFCLATMLSRAPRCPTSSQTTSKPRHAISTPAWTSTCAAAKLPRRTMALLLRALPTRAFPRRLHLLRSRTPTQRNSRSMPLR